MLMHLIEHAQEVGMKEFDFGAGAEGFKMRFANASVTVGRGFVALSPLENIVRHSRAIARNVIVNSPLDRPMRTAARWFRL